MTKPDKDRATETANLLEKLRQVSAALWNAPGGPSSEQFANLLATRETIITQLSPRAKLTAEQRREVSAILAGDRYLMQQMSNESAFIERRLQAIALRRRAANGYGRSKNSALNKTA